MSPDLWLRLQGEVLYFLLRLYPFEQNITQWQMQDLDEGVHIEGLELWPIGDARGIVPAVGSREKSSEAKACIYGHCFSEYFDGNTKWQIYQMPLMVLAKSATVATFQIPAEFATIHLWCQPMTNHVAAIWSRELFMCGRHYYTTVTKLPTTATKLFSFLLQ